MWEIHFYIKYDLQYPINTSLCFSRRNLSSMKMACLVYHKESTNLSLLGVRCFYLVVSLPHFRKSVQYLVMSPFYSFAVKINSANLLPREKMESVYIKWENINWKNNMFHSIFMILNSLAVICKTKGTAMKCRTTCMVHAGFEVSGNTKLLASCRRKFL